MMKHKSARDTLRFVLLNTLDDEERLIIFPFPS